MSTQGQEPTDAIETRATTRSLRSGTRVQTVFDDPRLVRLTLQGQHASRTAVNAPRLPPGLEATGTLLRLYETALRLFAERGYHGTSVRDLVGELGIKASSLYSHVPSKQHLLAELVRTGHVAHRDSLRLALLEAGAEPAEQVQALVRAHVLFHCEYSLLARLCNREIGSLDEDRLSSVLAVRLDSERLLLDVIERGSRLGVFDAPDPILAVAAVAAMGLRVAEWWRPGLGFSPDQVADTYARFAVRLLSE